ncbi:nuclease-related domain-containing protein [Neobacillus niacini]|uniref:nuclease-related domain-containing protein n=1 Tax=Neobacillus niacini TaxID=86668 RepID=UPI0021CB4C89|nr:nuclease-related domain-containing protein [Neobacillus niacini]MCM3764133.1 NERD domain-containing protein [Neobacillus niacini]
MVINIKERDPSLKLDGLIYAQSRLSPGHPMLPVLAGKQAAVEAGIGGEERVAEVFRKNSFPFPHHVFHDLSPTADGKFQTDNVVLTPWFGNVLEVKNIGGILEFKENPPQLIRTREDGRKDGFESPIVQLEKNCNLLHEWFQRRNIQLPIFGAVVLAYPKQIVAVPPAKTRLLFPNLIPPYLRGIPQPAQKLDIDTFNRLSTELLHSHHSFFPDPISEGYGIPISDFRPGVRCAPCGRIGMVKETRTWRCPWCGSVDHLAHVGTLFEWFLLCKRTITNRECRWFLGVDDIYLANRILQSMNLPSKGAFRYRTYLMDICHFKENNLIHK